MKLREPLFADGDYITKDGKLVMTEVEYPEYLDKRHYVTKRAFGGLFGLLEGHVSSVAKMLQAEFDMRLPNQFKVEYEVEAEWIWVIHVTDVIVNKHVISITRNMGYASDDETHEFD